jgi:hypothetical protein
MKKNFKKHFLYYFSLFTIFALGLILTLLVAPNIKLQSLIITITIILYVIWGIMHHYISHELTLKIMIEYALIGLLGVSILFFVMSGVNL